jgi:ATP-dependent Clp protease adapter protein ClpS
VPLTIDRDTIKSTDDQSNDQKPPMYAIVCHADTSRFSLITAVGIVHVMHHHIGLPTVEAEAITQAAMRTGRAVVKSGLTKEVGETIMADIKSCGFVQSNKSFDFKLEQV